MSHLSDGGRFTNSIHAYHQNNRWGLPVYINGHVARAQQLPDLFFKNGFDSSGILDPSLLHNAPDVFNQFHGRGNSYIGLYQNFLEFLVNILVNFFAPVNQGINFFNKTLTGFSQAVL
jgi:hypothetical protein